MKKKEIFIKSKKIGLEIHITLNTEKKIFNWNLNDETINNPNKNIGEWELGYLGSLPIINPLVIELAIKLSKLLNMKLEENLELLFDRKIYSYFDLPKGYQITQEYKKFSKNGEMTTFHNKEVIKFSVKSIHLEEDTAKSFRKSNDGKVNLDFKRAGKPLIELVTDPIFSEINQATSFVKSLIFLLNYSEISKARLERGEIRIDLNTSFIFSDLEGKIYQTPRYETKNLNSLKNASLAISQQELDIKEYFIREGKFEESSTFGFDESIKKITKSRTKTEYYYVPESNIPLIIIKSENLNSVNIPPISIDKIYVFFGKYLSEIIGDNRNSHFLRIISSKDNKWIDKYNPKLLTLSIKKFMLKINNNINEIDIKWDLFLEIYKSLEFSNNQIIEELSSEKKLNIIENLSKIWLHSDYKNKSPERIVGSLTGLIIKSKECSDISPLIIGKIVSEFVDKKMKKTF